MTKREKIIEILNDKLSVIVEQADIPGGTIIGRKIILGKNNVADEILALPLDVPSDEETGKWSYNGCSWMTPDESIDFDLRWYKGAVAGAKWMKEEIIKRNGNR